MNKNLYKAYKIGKLAFDEIFKFEIFEETKKLYR